MALAPIHADAPLAGALHAHVAPGSRAHRLLHGLLTVELVLVALSLGYWLMGSPHFFFRRLLNLDSDASIASWFSSAQLASVAVLWMLLARRGERAGLPARKWCWLAAGLFLFLSWDEMLMIHETANEILQRHEGLWRFKGGHGIWILMYGAVLAPLAVLGGREAWRLHRMHPVPVRWMAGGVAVFLLGAAGLEILAYQFLFHDPRSIGYVLEAHAEEFLEMFGITLVLVGSLLLHDRTR